MQFHEYLSCILCCFFSLCVRFLCLFALYDHSLCAFVYFLPCCLIACSVCSLTFLLRRFPATISSMLFSLSFRVQLFSVLFSNLLCQWSLFLFPPTIKNYNTSLPGIYSLCHLSLCISSSSFLLPVQRENSLPLRESSFKRVMGKGRLCACRQRQILFENYRNNSWNKCLLPLTASVKKS